MLASVMVKVGCMMDAHLANIEERLSPSRTLCPPLAMDRIAETMQLTPALSCGKQKARRAQSATVPEITAEGAPTVPETGKGEWVTVVNKPKKAKKIKTPAPVATTVTAVAQQPKQRQKKKRSQKPRLATPDDL